MNRLLFPMISVLIPQNRAHSNRLYAINFQWPYAMTNHNIHTHALQLRRKCWKIYFFRGNFMFTFHQQNSQTAFDERFLRISFDIHCNHYEMNQIVIHIVKLDIHSNNFQWVSVQWFSIDLNFFATSCTVSFFLCFVRAFIHFISLAKWQFLVDFDAEVWLLIYPI